jgi:hypothetical protein
MTVLEEQVADGLLTLGQQLSQGPLPLPEALRYAMTLAEALRQIHDSGRTYGALLPSNIEITAAGLELNRAPGQAPAITPYTAPEILQGHAPDSGTDIFAFGAIVYEMVTGQRAFAGDNGDALAVSLAISVPPGSGIPAIDHLVSICIAKDPAVRCRRMQKVILELKLLTFAPPDAVTRQQAATEALRAETKQLESRLAGLLHAHEKSMAEMQQASNAVIQELRGRLANTESELAALQERTARAEQGNEALSQRATAHFEQVEQSIEGINERADGVKDEVEALSQGATVLREYVGTRMHEFEQTVKSQRSAVASVSAGQAQTDDVVERIVAALELLQSCVYDSAEESGQVAREDAA